jgi:endonuclease/exonuclease/phosphatase family metal-dependent hydrolase
LSDDGALRVATWNILYDTSTVGGGGGEARWPLVVRGLRDADADLVALQEVLPGRIAVLPRDLPGYAMTVSEPGGTNRPILPLLGIAALAALLIVVRRTRRGDRDPAARRPFVARWAGRALGAGLWLVALGIPAGHALGSWYVGGSVGGYAKVNERLVLLHRPSQLRLLETRTAWFSPAPDRPGSRGPFEFEPRIAQWARYERPALGDTIEVVNVHPGHDPAHHARDAAIVLALIGPPAPGRTQLVVGDFNATAETRRLGDLIAAGFRDAWLEAPRRKGAPGTFHGARAANLRIDHVLVRGPMRAVWAETRVVAEGALAASDHDPVIVNLELPR